MPLKSTPYSVRVSEADSEFLSSLNIPGATSPSEKIRALISEARLNRAGTMSYSDGLSFQDGQLAALKRSLFEMERETNLHSELVIQFLNWLPEIAAYLRAELGSDVEKDAKDRLVALENGLADRIISLFEGNMRLAVTPVEPCYSPECIKSRINPILELLKIINTLKSRVGKELDDE